jgi:hypothetical protein
MAFRHNGVVNWSLLCADAGSQRMQHARWSPCGDCRCCADSLALPKVLLVFLAATTDFKLDSKHGRFHAEKLVHVMVLVFGSARQCDIRYRRSRLLIETHSEGPAERWKSKIVSKLVPA